MSGTRTAGIVAAVLVTAAVVGAAVWLIRSSEALPDGPVPVVWNRTQCAECRMSVSDRAFAAQLQLEDGRVLDFDDPGCLFLYERREAGPVHAVWFHHVREDRWLPEAEAGFVTAGPSPMGYDLGAVDNGVPGAKDLDAVRAQFADGLGRGEEDARGR